MAKTGLSEREYGAHLGLSRGAVREAKKTARLVLYPDGSIDAEASDNSYASLTSPIKAKAVLGRAAEDAPDPAAFLKARTANEELKAARATLALARERGELIDRHAAEALVFRLARQERDAWVTWPARVAALVAAQIMADVERTAGAAISLDPGTIQRVLEDVVNEHLESLAAPNAKLG